MIRYLAKFPQFLQNFNNFEIIYIVKLENLQADFQSWEVHQKLMQ